MSLRSQKRLASEILKIGINRVWIDPEKIDDVDLAITRAEIRKLIHEGTIQAKAKKGISRSRARILHIKRKRGLRKGAGSKTGRRTARMPRKKAWQTKIRAIRAYLKALKLNRIIQRSSYRHLYLMAKGGAFSSVADVDRYIETNELVRRR